MSLAIQHTVMYGDILVEKWSRKGPQDRPACSSERPDLRHVCCTELWTMPMEVHCASGKDGSVYQLGTSRAGNCHFCSSLVHTTSNMVIRGLASEVPKCSVTIIASFHSWKYSVLAKLQKTIFPKGFSPRACMGQVWYHGLIDHYCQSL